MKELNEETLTEMLQQLRELPKIQPTHVVWTQSDIRRVAAARGISVQAMLDELRALGGIEQGPEE